MSNERDKTILELVELTSVDEVNDFIPIVEQASNETKKVSASNLPVSTAQQTALDLKADDADLTAHTNNTSNPHSVTATQVGLGNVDNTSDADKPVSTAQQAALDLKADDADLTAHTGNTSNPHSVTAAQVGLGNVDNTSDADKPVSTAQQTALDLKADATALTTETNARVDADNRREFAGGVYLVESTITSSLNYNLGINTFTILGYFSADYDSTNNGLFHKGVSTNGLIELRQSSASVLRFIWRKGSNNFHWEFNFNSDNTSKLLQITFDPKNDSAPTVYVNGNTETISSVVGSYSYDSTYNDTNYDFVLGSRDANVDKFIGSISDFAIFNTALTATQAAELYQQGLQPWLAANPEYRRGQDVYASDFSAGTDGWSLLSGDETSTFTHSTNKVVLEVTATGTNSNRPVINRSGIIENNQPYLISFSYNVISGTCIFNGYFDGGAVDTSHQETLSGNGVKTFEFLRSSGPSQLAFYFDSSNLFNLEIIDIEITQLGSLATLPLKDDCRQLKDISGNRNDATASESGVTHLKQANQHSFRDDNADGTGGSYLIANADILAENEVITGVTVDGRFYSASGDQDLTKRRIKLQDNGWEVDIKRSNGTTDDAPIAITNPSDGTDFAITVLTQRI